MNFLFFKPLQPFWKPSQLIRPHDGLNWPTVHWWFKNFSKQLTKPFSHKVESKKIQIAFLSLKKLSLPFHQSLKHLIAISSAVVCEAISVTQYLSRPANLQISELETIIGASAIQYLSWHIFGYGIGNIFVQSHLGQNHFRCSSW